MFYHLKASFAFEAFLILKDFISNSLTTSQTLPEELESTLSIFVGNCSKKILREIADYIVVEEVISTVRKVPLYPHLIMLLLLKIEKTIKQKYKIRLLTLVMSGIDKS